MGEPRTALDMTEQKTEFNIISNSERIKSTKMLKYKKVLSFTLAMILCISLIITNASAVIFVAPSTKIQFSDYDAMYGKTGQSFALAKITKYGQNDEITDLEIATHVYNHERIFNPTNCTTTIEVYAQLTVVMNDFIENRTEDWFTCGKNGYFARVKLFGRNLIDESHYIIDFTSRHTVNVREWSYTDSGDLIATPIYVSGGIIEYN